MLWSTDLILIFKDFVWVQYQTFPLDKIKLASDSLPMHF